MKKSFRYAVAALLTLCACIPAHAQPGSTGLTFLRNGVGARAVAMGETGVADAAFGEALYYNPALAASGTSSSLTIMHQQSVQDISAQYLGAVAVLDSWSIGMHIHLASVEDIELRLVPGDPDGMFTSRNFSLGLTAAYRLGDVIAGGVTAKFLYEKLHVDDASGYAFDLGLRARPFAEGVLHALSFGASVSNMGRMSELRAVSSKLPVIVRAGAAWETPVQFARGTARAAVDAVSYPSDKRVRAHVGIEASYEELLVLRAGYQTGFDIKGFSAGVGFVLSAVRFDYAFVPYTDSYGTAHTLSLSLVF